MFPAEPFEEEHTVTEMMDTTTINPNLPNEDVVTEQYINAKSWQRVEERTDTDEIIAYRVHSILDNITASQKGATLVYLGRITFRAYLIQHIILWSMVNGHQPLAMVCFSIILGFCFLGRDDDAMRMGIGYAIIYYVVIGYSLDRLFENCQDGFCSPLEYVVSVAPVFALAVIWGTLAALGFNPGAYVQGWPS
mgnify:FL=1